MNRGNGNVIKKHKKDNFTVVDNDILKNKELSLKEKGLLIILLSLPDNWEFNESGLSQLSSDGVISVRSGLKGLEALGYLMREQFRNEKGHYSGSVYHIYEVSQKNKPHSEQPYSVNPMSVITHNKELSNKELTNKEITNINTIVEQPKERYDYSSVIDYLNEVTGSNYRNASSHQAHIRARYKEGYTLEDFKQVIDIKSAEWKNNKEYSKYLRPSTLFGNKFDTYLNQVSKHKEELNRAKPILEFT